MAPVQTTYSFKDLTGVLACPMFLPVPFPIVGGNIGNGTITIKMITQRTEHDTAADGTVMPSYVPGQSAEVTIEVQQTSQFHHALLDLYNLLSTAADGGAIAAWASMILSLRTVLDGSGHFLSGVSFQKIPDKLYASKGGMLTWVLMAASAVNQ